MQLDRGVGAAMDEMTNRIGLDRGLGEFPDVAEIIQFGTEIDRCGWMLKGGSFQRGNRRRMFWLPWRRRMDCWI